MYLVTSADGAVKASPLGAGTSVVKVPHGPAPESASAVGAGGWLAPPTTELNTLAIAAKKPRPPAAVARSAADVLVL